MPSQISDVEEFVRISERAEECRVKRLEDVVKLKLRTPSKLYTIRLNAEEAAEVLKRLKCEVVET
jgi:phenylalanyl-tRNA synthetase beta subunit